MAPWRPWRALEFCLVLLFAPLAAAAVESQQSPGSEHISLVLCKFSIPVNQS